MLAFLGASENIVFVTAIVLMLLIGVMQLIGLGGHFGLDADHDIDFDADGDLNLLGWLGLGRLPLLMLLVVFLTIFGLTGLIGQQVLDNLTGHLLNGWIAVPAALLFALPLTGLGARVLAPILPHDETTAVSLDTLVGRFGKITTGRAMQGSPARTRVEDRYGQAHYVMVEPDTVGQIFEEGDAVILVRREDGLFRAISRGDNRLPRIGG
ncbi:YqiJ family protein [Stakelama sediminis]|uniref:DUF1449 family protein n=1 Tax=Stakelama sediminis TaxID=463200 RepID=A0A840Z1L9_9SPHN|nr:hypothetical protein [Stakelama sediminis]